MPAPDDGKVNFLLALFLPEQSEQNFDAPNIFTAFVRPTITPPPQKRQKILTDRAVTSFYEQIQYKISYLVRSVKSEQRKQEDLRAELRAQEAQRERKYDQLISEYKKLVDKLNVKTKFTKDWLEKQLRQWDSKFAAILPAMANTPFPRSKIDKMLKHSQPAVQAMEDMENIKPNLLNEKRYYLFKNFRKFNDQLIQEKIHLAKQRICRSVFVRHQDKRRLCEEDAEEKYLIDPIRLGEVDIREKVTPIVYDQLQPNQTEEERQAGGDSQIAVGK